MGPNADSKNPRTTSITLQQKEDYKANQSESSGDSLQRKIMTGAQLIKQTTLIYLLDKDSTQLKELLFNPNFIEKILENDPNAKDLDCKEKFNLLVKKISENTLFNRKYLIAKEVYEAFSSENGSHENSFFKCTRGDLAVLEKEVKKHKEEDGKNRFLKTATNQLSFDQADIDNFLNLQKNANFESRGDSSTLDEKQLWGKLKSSLEDIPKEEEKTKKIWNFSFFQCKRSKTSNFESLSNLIDLKLHDANENEPKPKPEPEPEPKSKPKKPKSTNSLTECALIFGIIPVEDFRNTLRSLQIASSRFNKKFKKEMDGKTPNPVFATINAVSAFVSSLQNSDKSKEK